jgi:hypothetical protein
LAVFEYVTKPELKIVDAPDCSIIEELNNPPVHDSATDILKLFLLDNLINKETLSLIIELENI